MKSVPQENAAKYIKRRT